MGPMEGTTKPRVFLVVVDESEERTRVAFGHLAGDQSLTDGRRHRK